jgi:exodeoxyribonuclease V alpha subunit
VETAFAMTVHKSQGSEFEHALLVLPAATGGVVGRELVYTGITRARQRFTLAEAVDGAFKSALARTAQRSSGLGFRLAPMPLAQ